MYLKLNGKGFEVIFEVSCIIMKEKNVCLAQTNHLRPRLQGYQHTWNSDPAPLRAVATKWTPEAHKFPEEAIEVPTFPKISTLL